MFPAQYVEKGFGQVELNKVSAIRSGNVEAQLPALDPKKTNAPYPQIENGMLLVVRPNADSKNRFAACLPENAEGGQDTVYLVANEKNLYNPADGYCDYIARAKDNLYGVIYPRLLKLEVGDVFTTNTVEEATINVGDTLYAGDNGFLTSTKEQNQSFSVVVMKLTTMPDGQKAVKVKVTGQSQ